jgi:hypothetical protein
MDGGSEAGGLTVTCMLMSNTEMSYCCLLRQATNRLELKKQIEVETHRFRGTATMLTGENPQDHPTCAPPRPEGHIVGLYGAGRRNSEELECQRPGRQDSCHDQSFLARLLYIILL